MTHSHYVGVVVWAARKRIAEEGVAEVEFLIVKGEDVKGDASKERVR